jgi:hypothetical protein
MEIASLLYNGLWTALLILSAVSIFRRFFAKPKTVSAEVVGKQTVEWFSKYAGNGKRTRYVVNFLVEGKKKSFYVSEFSYNGYRKGERGTLTYQGDRLIDFS